MTDTQLLLVLVAGGGMVLYAIYVFERLYTKRLAVKQLEVGTPFMRPVINMQTLKGEGPDTTSPLMAKADKLVADLLQLYIEAVPQGWFLEVEVGPMGTDLELAKLPLVRLNWLRASTTNPTNNNAEVRVNPANPGK